MQTIHPRRGGAGRSRTSAPGLRRPLLVFLTAAALAARAGAQAPPRLVISTTSDVAATAELEALADEALVAAGGARAPTPQLAANHWLAQAGFVPGDIDAFARLESFPPGDAGSYVFSLLADENGFRDGDILTFTPGGGVEVLFAEDYVLEALGLSGGNLDVDACDIDPLGQLVVSLQNDAAGTSLGTVSDGDVLRIRFDGLIDVLATEAQVQASFSIATGLGDAIGDVQGLCLVDDELWVAVQSPSSHDGAVLAIGADPRIVVEEADVGLGGAEIDALSPARDGDELACLTLSATAALEGDTLHLELYGRPGEAYLLVQSGAAGTLFYPGFTGFGAFYVDPFDPWLAMVVASTDDSVVVLDGGGRASADYAIPLAPVWGPGPGGADGWSFQLLSASGEISAPLRVERM